MISGAVLSPLSVQSLTAAIQRNMLLCEHEYDASTGVVYASGGRFIEYDRTVIVTDAAGF